MAVWLEQANRLFRSRHKLLSLRTSLLLIVVELSEGGSAINGATFFLLFSDNIFTESAPRLIQSSSCNVRHHNCIISSKVTAILMTTSACSVFISIISWTSYYSHLLGELALGGWMWLLALVTWHVTPDTGHMTPEEKKFLKCMFCIGATNRTHRGIQCIPYAGFKFFNLVFFSLFFL